MSNFFSIEEIQGQDTALQYIRHYVKSPHMIPPLLVFYGPASVGKWALAERFSRHILCLTGFMHPADFLYILLSHSFY